MVVASVWFLQAAQNDREPEGQVESKLRKLVLDLFCDFKALDATSLTRAQSETDDDPT